MPTISYLASPATSGYTEEREATYNDDGTLKSVLIFVTWNDGTKHHLSIDFAGPPDYTFHQTGALAYPDGSLTTVDVPPDGTLVLTHDWRYHSGPKDIIEHQNSTQRWVFQPDGSGSVDTTGEYDNGFSYGVTKEWHSFDRDGSLVGDVHTVDTDTNSETHISSTVSTVTTPEGKRTVHTVIFNPDGSPISDTVQTLWLTPPSERKPPVTTEQGTGAQEGEPQSPVAGPQVGAAVKAGTGGGDGICAIARSLGSGRDVCKHYTDYYSVTTVKMKGEEKPGVTARYLGSRFHGLGPC